MKNSEKPIGKNFIDEHIEKYIEFPVPVVNPYMCKVYGAELATAAGISSSELDELMTIGTSPDPDGYYGCRLEALLKKNSPNKVDKFLMYKLRVLDDAGLSDWYARITNRVNRYKELLRLDAPTIIYNNEADMIQKAVNDLYFGNAEVNRDGLCLWTIAAKILNVSK